MSYKPDEHIIGYGKRIAYTNDTVFAEGAYPLPAGDAVWVDVFGTQEIQLPERELGEAEVTNDDSPDFHLDYQPGMIEPGTVPFTYTYSRTEFAKVETLFQLASVKATRAAATKWWRVTLPDGSTARFRGYVKKNSLPLANGGETAVVEAELRVRGKMKFDAAS